MVMNRKRMMKLVFICTVLVLLLVILYSGLQILESTFFPNEQEGAATESRWIVRDGVRYYPRQDITVILLMGIDRAGEITGGESDQGHAADMIALMVFDEKNEKSELLLLNRDTMVMMNGLDSSGNVSGKYYRQLALSHTDGTGREDSCENVCDTVSNMLNGIDIDYYISMDFGGIAILNDAVGGVTVQVTDDFSAIDSSIGMGEITLYGEQAVNFIRSRKNLGDQLNLSRIERHKEYLSGFVKALREELQNDSEFALSLYGKISPYIVTNCSMNSLAGIIKRFSDYELVEIVSTEGENITDKKDMEFYVDEEKLDELILRLFYAPHS